VEDDPWRPAASIGHRTNGDQVSDQVDEVLRTALVVLATPASASAGGGYTVASGPPKPAEGAAKVHQWFAAQGFAVDPVVGISFSISGPERLFRRVLGMTDPGSPVELGPAELAGQLDNELLRYVAAVVVGPPPDFGPENL
jgi:hypothetical protein